MNAKAANAGLTGALDSMGLDELRELRKNLDRAISSFEGRRRQQAISAAEQVAKEHGFKLAELLGGRRAGKAKGADEGSSAPQAAYVTPTIPSRCGAAGAAGPAGFVTRSRPGERWTIWPRDMKWGTGTGRFPCVGSDPSAASSPGGINQPEGAA